MILLRLQDVKLLPTGINRIVQDDGKIIRAARGDGIGGNRHPLVQWQGYVRAAQQIEISAHAAGGIEL